MRVNPIPFVVAPGIAAIGFVVGGVGGLEVALGIWSLLVIAGTLLRALRLKIHSIDWQRA